MRMEKSRLPRRTQEGLVMMENQQMKASNGPEFMKARNTGNQKQSVILRENWNKVLICRDY